ncbi:peptidoglycan recognition protein family protein [Paenibacillus macquariensis]|uniref:N-acetylmuramoyl-L-alanine amidase n=1 Tax=Paenibacillus macquariensis TaxID=948756 RepID=A0ABY1JSA9_9BACL|nr:peptidoglycan recognition family protein [Paenibacillus macquariensis]MEC0092901.1 peptidoglycan recognition family protein [Paenibacillus macquariensis]OAB36270.1 hypothetical protein PMSM_07430 [Paenibacillus macquariensis subsp. macquariensis]SIQ68411.1 N-acetylmuramoyl-L-alanine amidase [Paenibacillus macquariensis]
MIKKGNYLLLECGEFRNWLSDQRITRTINKLQVHHTASPNYTTRKMVMGIAQQDHFKCLEGMRDFHINTNGWSATGQNITVFEDGKIAISLDRDLSKVPAGMAGANTGMLCVEIIGNFDKGGDKITAAQKQAVIHLYACLVERFKMPIDTDHIVYHAWYTSKGLRLNDYTHGKSSKSCPGTNFWGDGNTIASAKNSFLPMIKAELDGLGKEEPKMKKVDANKIIDTYLKPAYAVAKTPAERKDVGRLADELRIASGQSKQNG